MRYKFLLGLAIGSLALCKAYVSDTEHEFTNRGERQDASPIKPHNDRARYYSVTDLGIMPNCDQTRACGINNKGQIVGFCTRNPDTSRASYYAYVYDNGRMTPLGTLGGKCSIARGINNRGEIAGWADTKSGDGHAFIIHDGKMLDLGTTHGWASHAHAINDKGQVVGVVYTGPRPRGRGCVFEPSHAFLWTAGRMVDLGTLGGKDSEAHAINNNGQIAGESYRPQSTYGIGAFLTTPGGKVSDHAAFIPTLSESDSMARSDSMAYGINELGQIVGRSGFGSSGRCHAFLFSAGKLTDLGTLGDPYSEAKAINNRGQIVGISFGTRVPRAFIFENGKMIDLNTCVPESSWILREATAINDAGQIVCNGEPHNGKGRAFLLTPTP